MKTRRQFLIASASAVIAMAACSGKVVIADEAWPEKPVRVVVPYLAGGSADKLGRLAARHLESTLQTPFVVENRGGAGGMVGSQHIARSEPDGYPLLVAGIGSHVVAPLRTPGQYDPLADFTYIAMLGGTPSVLVVNADVPVTNLKEFIEYVKKQPQGLSWGSSGHGTHGNLIGEVFRSINDLNMVHVAYKGFPLSDLLGNQIPAAVTTINQFGPHIKSGKLRGLAVTSEKRLESYPDIPTFAELGYPQLTSLTWFGLAGPANMPKPIVDRINTEVRKAFDSPELQAQFVQEDTVTMSLDAEDFSKFVESEIDTWTPFMKTLAND